MPSSHDERCGSRSERMVRAADIASRGLGVKEAMDDIHTTGPAANLPAIERDLKGVEMTLDRRMLALVLMASLGTMLTACQRESTPSVDRTSSASQPSRSAPQPGGMPPSSPTGSQGNDSTTNTAAAPAPAPSDSSASGSPSSPQDKSKSKEEMSKEKTSS